MIAAHPAEIHTKEIPLEEAKVLAADLESAVGHDDTAAVFSGLLGIAVATNRASVMLCAGDSALIGQYRGPRLPEGAKTLPEGAAIQWLLVTVR